MVYFIVAIIQHVMSNSFTALYNPKNRGNEEIHSVNATYSDQEEIPSPEDAFKTLGIDINDTDALLKAFIAVEKTDSNHNPLELCYFPFLYAIIQNGGFRSALSKKYDWFNSEYGNHFYSGDDPTKHYTFGDRELELAFSQVLFFNVIPSPEDAFEGLGIDINNTDALLVAFYLLKETDPMKKGFMKTYYPFVYAIIKNNGFRTALGEKYGWFEYQYNRYFNPRNNPLRDYIYPGWTRETAFASRLLLCINH